MIDITEQHLPRDAGDRKVWDQLAGSAAALAVAGALGVNPGRSALIVTPDTRTADMFHQELLFFLEETQKRVAMFPDWETLIYDSFSPHQDLISTRLEILNQLAESGLDALIIPAQTLMQRLAPRSFILAHSLMLQKGQAFNREQMRLKLTASAYRAVDLVSEHGEFAVRGAIMDIFPMGSPHPYRIDLFDDEIESIRVFDPETQLSSDRVDGIKLLPAQEIPLDETAINHFKDQFHTRFQVDPRSCPLYKDVASGLSSPGIEYYLPLFFSTTETILDYLPEDTLIFSYDIEASLNRHWDSAQVRYESLKYDIEKPILPPDTLLLPVNETNARLKHYPQVRLSEASLAAPAWRQSFQGTPLPDLAIEERGKDPLARLKSVIKDDSRRLLIVAESIGRREIIDETLMKHGIHCAVVDGWQDFVTSDTSPAITAFDLNRGLCLPDALVITEQALFGERVLQSRRRQTSQADNNAELIIRSLTELNLGSPVVHIDHGVGRYGGLKTLTIDDQPHEFLCLTYRDDDRLYVPVASLHLISRYAGTEEETAPLHRLGGETWIKARKKAAEKARDAAAELLDIYARREAKQGFSYASPDEEYTRFAADFPFEETPDQQKAIEEVIADMCRNKPMDRLICGDVGFGKTEVAMRAAFLAVQAGRQVAVLVPTTLLAQQHTETFRDRFAAWPVTVETLSRFRTQKEKQVTVKNAMDGRVDIIIGTHALIQDGLDFHNLGLLIIDEEHRFGVRQKERLKSLRAEVDILTLTATPIPRTLNMAISSMRDLSIISTPPARRLSIRTFVRQRQDGLVREAIQRELQRGGQVYYLHNEVRTIENTARKVEELIPEARVSVAHGQMRERDLEKVMSDFYHKRANVLVCTTIIETGIDIPNANTIIMDRADKLGLAQIHQLRGRVGRSHHQAYAYLLTPHARAMTRDAVKRLEAIQEAEQLGSGFVLATHDLEIRGAGELLGDEQTGHIQTIGFSLYMEMLENAVTAIREGKTPDLDKPLGTGSEVNMRIPALIPEDYLADVHQRLVMYKRISSAVDDAALRDLQVEMIDRFGLLPEATKTLFRITSIKLIAERWGVSKIECGPEKGRMEFSQDTPIDPSNIVQLVQQAPAKYRLTSANQLTVSCNMEKPETRFQEMEKLLSLLTTEKNTDKASRQTHEAST